MTPDRVMAEVEAVMAPLFEYGACDCASAACDVYQRLWGVDLLAPWRGYAGARSALRLIRSEGGAAMLAEKLAHRNALQPGHAIGGLALSLAGPRGRRSLLICIQPGLWAGKSIRGFSLLRAADRGWHA